MSTDQKIVIPKFKSEAEEAEWWDTHPGVVTAIVERAASAGKLRRGPLRTVTMRLPEADIAIAQEQALRKGLPYQTYIKLLLHEALERAKRSQH